MWNYRRVKSKYGIAIHEAYYDENGVIEAITENPIHVYGDNKKDIKLCYELIGRAFDKPVIKWSKKKKKFIELG